MTGRTRVIGHAITTVPHGNGWQDVCLCGWESLPGERVSEVAARSAHHLTEAAKVRAVTVKAHARKVMDASLTESLARADDHIDRCPKEGDQRWQKTCHTCAALAAQRSKQRTTA